MEPNPFKGMCYSLYGKLIKLYSNRFQDFKVYDAEMITIKMEEQKFQTEIYNTNEGYLIAVLDQGEVLVVTKSHSRTNALEFAKSDLKEVLHKNSMNKATLPLD
jgi:hypothetical protein